MGQRIDCEGQSKHGGVEFACDMERGDGDAAAGGVVMSEGGGGSGGSGVDQRVEERKRGLVTVSSAIGGRSGDGLNGPGAKSGSRNLVFATARTVNGLVACHDAMHTTASLKS